MNVFNGVTSAHVILLPLRFTFNLSYGLKPQVNRIKIVTVFRRSMDHISISSRFYFGMEFTSIRGFIKSWHRAN